MPGSKVFCFAPLKMFRSHRRGVATLTTACCLSFALTSARCQTVQAQEQGQIGYHSASDADQRKTVLLKDFHPKSMLHVPEHSPQRAKFYVLDVHNHTNDPAGIGDQMPPQDVVSVMDQTNVKTIVILTGMWGDKLDRKSVV